MALTWFLPSAVLHSKYTSEIHSTPYTGKKKNPPTLKTKEASTFEHSSEFNINVKPNVKNSEHINFFIKSTVFTQHTLLANV
jgi:hypothetical protein